MPQPELGSLEGILRFVSEFVTYEPLGGDDALAPSHLVSPQSTLKWQVTAHPP